MKKKQKINNDSKKRPELVLEMYPETDSGRFYFYSNNNLY